MAAIAAEHALDVGRHRAVAAEQSVPAEEPQVAGLRDRMLGSLRRLVRVGQSFGPIGEDLA